MDLQTVDIRVGRTLKEYIIATNGNETLIPQKDTVLWCLVKQHLITSAAGYQAIPEDLKSEYIKIALRNVANAKTYNIHKEGIVGINTLFRCFLTRDGENSIKRHLEKEFKKTFRDYMKGALNNNVDMQIKDAIEEFCTDHNIVMNNITFDMLKQDWYRFRRKGTKVNVCTLIY